jgi:diaminopimelate epimerase
MLRIASASGNVFGYLWRDEVPESFDGPRWARVLCARGTGLGLDGLFLLHRQIPEAPWVMEHWEPDGAHTFCSNGTRAAASLLPSIQRGRIQGAVSGECVSLCVDENRVGLRLPEGDRYCLQVQLLPMELPHAYGWTGTPHLVIEVQDVDRVDFPSFAPPLRWHPLLPEGANVSILQILTPGRARIRTWERGVEGETLCCGQGCAVAGAWLATRSKTMDWHFQPAGDDPVQVSVEGVQDGKWAGLWLSGPVRRIGTFEPDPSLLRGT